MADNNKKPNSSAIKSSGFTNFLSTLFGWRRSNKQKSNVEFSKVDIGGQDQRIGQALLNSLPNVQGKLGQKLEQLFDIWLTDNTDKYTELQQRINRVNQLEFMVQNDPYCGRIVDLYADESCQLDQQDTIIRIDTPDARMTKDMYKLLNQWGVTQTRIRETMKQLGTYGDAFWSNSVSERGVERILPLQQLQVTDRIEFNPIKALEMKKRREGFFSQFANNNYLIAQMLDDLEDKNSFADMFDTKLFGFSIDNDLIVPAWNITHFRVGSEGSMFYPWGTSPILGALAPYKQTQASIALQALGRELNFPVTTYEVKTDENMDEASQFAVVDRVREAYDNIGTSQQVGNSEVYTVNTKMWLPKDLLTVNVHKTDTASADGVDDIKLYQDRTAVALGLPKSFYGEEGWKSLGNSGKSLTQQYKPFARKCFSLQSAFLEGLADLFRIHFAITGQYDFRIPFTLSMKYPAIEEDDSFVNSKKASIEVADAVIGLVKASIGASEEEPLPADIVRDIIGKYTFLDPEDIIKWTRDAKYYVNLGGEDEEGGESGGMGMGGEMPTLESKERRVEQRLREYEKIPRTEEQKLREAKLKESYFNRRGEIYFEALKECGVNNFTGINEHTEVFNTSNSRMDVMLEVLNRQHTSERLHEGFSLPKKKKGRKKKAENVENHANLDFETLTENNN